MSIPYQVPEGSVVQRLRRNLNICSATRGLHSLRNTRSLAGQGEQSAFIRQDRRTDE